MATWVECETMGDPPRPMIINLDRVISVSGNDRGSVIRYGEANGTDTGEIVVTSSPGAILMGQKVRSA
jgi:hypothetical protein